MTGYAVKHSIRAEDIRILRKKLKLTQKICKVSKCISENNRKMGKWKSGYYRTGYDISSYFKRVSSDRGKPPRAGKEYPIRLWYMFKSEICTIIDVDERGRKVKYIIIQTILLKSIWPKWKTNLWRIRGISGISLFPETTRQNKIGIRRFESAILWSVYDHRKDRRKNGRGWFLDQDWEDKMVQLLNRISKQMTDNRQKETNWNGAGTMYGIKLIIWDMRDWWNMLFHVCWKIFTETGRVCFI